MLLDKAGVVKWSMVLIVSAGQGQGQGQVTYGDHIGKNCMYVV